MCHMPLQCSTGPHRSTDSETFIRARHRCTTLQRAQFPRSSPHLHRANIHQVAAPPQGRGGVGHALHIGVDALAVRQVLRHVEQMVRMLD